MMMMQMKMTDLKDTEVLGQDGGKLGGGVVQSFLVELQGFLDALPQDDQQLQQTCHDRGVLHRQNILQHLFLDTHTHTFTLETSFTASYTFLLLMSVCVCVN